MRESKDVSGKYIATVRVGEKGQIVIPKRARDMFAIEPGDTLLLLGDVERGLAIVPYAQYADMAKAILDSREEQEEEL